MKTRTFILIVLGLLPAAVGRPAANPQADLVSQAFRDGGFLPHVYREQDVLRRYGDGDRIVDAAGLIRHRYLDPTTRLEVMITSNPDIDPKFRAVEEILVSSISTGQPAFAGTESLRNLQLKGVAIGDPVSKAVSAARRHGQVDIAQAKLGAFSVRRICAFSEGGSNLCFYARDEKVVAMAVGFGP